MASLAKQLEPFFGEDPRGVHYVVANFEGTAYDKPLPADKISGTTIGNLMLCKNYLDSARTSDQKDNDVHQDFADFFIRRNV